MKHPCGSDREGREAEINRSVFIIALSEINCSECSTELLVKE